MRRLALALTAAIGGLTAASLPAQAPVAPPVPAAPADETDVFSYEEKGKLMSVPVTVTGQGPFSFLVDSGAERTVISSELAAQLALSPGKKVRMHSMTEARTVATARIPRIQFSRKQVTDISAPQLPRAYLRAAGILGVDTLRKQRVEFDFVNETMSITASRDAPVDNSANAIVVTARSLYGRLVITDAYIEGQKVLAIIDTGSNVSVANRALQAILDRKGRLRPIVQVEATSVTGGRFMVDYTSVNRLKVGSLIVSNMPIGFADTHLFRQLKVEDQPVVMLGMDALRLFAKVSVDFSRKEVRFELPRERTTRRLAAAD